jgi:hypothetical protein
MKYFIILIISLPCILSSCHVCRESVIPVKHFETDYGCPDTKHTLEIDLTDQCTLIQTRADYDNQVSGTCHPDIDFDTYYLVIGKQSTANEVDTIYYDYGISCPENDLTLTVEIIQDAVAVKDTVVYHALIPKQENSGTIVINVKVK